MYIKFQVEQYRLEVGFFGIALGGYVHLVEKNLATGHIEQFRNHYNFLAKRNGAELQDILTGQGMQAMWSSFLFNLLLQKAEHKCQQNALGAILCVQCREKYEVQSSQ